MGLPFLDVKALGSENRMFESFPSCKLLLTAGNWAKEKALCAYYRYLSEGQNLMEFF
jgi:hypothetical protein